MNNNHNAYGHHSTNPSHQSQGQSLGMNNNLKDRRNSPLPPLGGLPGDPNVPSMSANPVSSLHGLLTPNSGGQHDVVSPGSSSGVHTGSSHNSALSSISQYSHASWSAGAGGASSGFGFSSNAPHHYDHKPASFDSASSGVYTVSRPSQGSIDQLPAPSYSAQSQQQQHQPQQPQHQQSHHFSLFGHSNNTPGGSSTLPSHVSATATSPGGIMGHSNSNTSQPPTPSSATAPHDPYNRPPSTQNYFSAASTPHQPSFPAYSPTIPSPPGIGPGSLGLSAPRHLHSHSGMAPPPGYRQYPNGFNMHIPSMNGGPILSNLSNPGGQMSVMSGLPVSPYGPPMHGSIYGSQVAQPERPYKCQQCPQSFNRNHDLKRHTRIHLSVKPFPCGTCEKAFSRKDALKRHRLVKGCGDPSNAENIDNNDGSGNSDASASQSPTIMKRE